MSTEAYSWRSPFDETGADVPVVEALDALDKASNGSDLNPREASLVEAVERHRPDLAARAGYGTEEGVYNA
jgi:hypothetical protein